MNVELAKLCCRACSYGYDRMVGMDSQPASVLAIDETLIEVDTSAVLVIEQPERRLVVFPGTQSEWELLNNPSATWESVRDWLRNLAFRLISGAEFGVPGRLHRGFAEELGRVLPRLSVELSGRRDLFGEKPLVLTGHSQGGAIAAIATGVLPANGHQVAASYTFAAPRPGDYGFAESIKVSDTPIWRMEYGNDVVPHLPLSPELHLTEVTTNLLDFHAVGQLVYGRPNCASVIVTDSAAITHEERRSRMLSHREDWIEHHHLPHYMALLERFP